MGAKEEPMLFAKHRGEGESKDVLFIDDITDAIAYSPVRAGDGREIRFRSVSVG